MTYKPEWKGHLNFKGITAKWDGQVIGRITQRYVEGAKSPGGLKTNAVFDAVRSPESTEDDGLPDTTRTFASMTLALEWLIGDRVSKIQT